MQPGKMRSPRSPRGPYSNLTDGKEKLGHRHTQGESHVRTAVLLSQAKQLLEVWGEAWIRPALEPSGGPAPPSSGGQTSDTVLLL